MVAFNHEESETFAPPLKRNVLSGTEDRDSNGLAKCGGSDYFKKLNAPAEQRLFIDTLHECAWVCERGHIGRGRREGQPSLRPHLKPLRSSFQLFFGLGQPENVSLGSPMNDVHE
eukprot:2450982-Amphidinium_carterae.3